MNTTLQQFLEQSAQHHGHLCPRQVLGVRMGMIAANLLSISLPQTDKRVLTIVETDGCAVDGISVSTGCTVGHRTLRIEDYGKIAATFYDTQELIGYRIAPRHEIRELSRDYSPATASKWERYLVGYQRIPDALLFSIKKVELATPIRKIVSRPSIRAICRKCGEEIMNEREVLLNNESYCCSCAGDSYYIVIDSVEEPEVEQCSRV